MARILPNVPKQVRRGEVIEIKLLISHPMETGQRRDGTGQVVPRNIIRDVTCTCGSAEVVRLELFPAVSANPFLHFAARAEASGPVAISQPRLRPPSAWRIRGRKRRPCRIF